MCLQPIIGSLYIHSGGLCDAPVIPAGIRSFLSESGGITLPNCHSGDRIEPFQSQDWNGDRNGQEWNPAECKNVYNLDLAEMAGLCLYLEIVKSEYCGNFPKKEICRASS